MGQRRKIPCRGGKNHERKMNSMDRDLFRHVLYLVFLWVYIAFIIVLIFAGIQNGFGFVEGLGIGAILGVMTKQLSDGWQFFFRKSGTK